ncbi:MAG: magnesium chelatase subunit H [Promethearchaeota archaeon]
MSKNRVLCITTIANTFNLFQAVKQIYKEYGGIFELKKVYLDEFEQDNVPIDLLKEEIEKSNIILVDLRGDVKVARALPELLKSTGNTKTVVVLIGGGSHIFSLTRMGKFHGDLMFKPDKDVEFNIHMYMKTQKFSKLTKKLGRIFPIGILKDMRNWILCQNYYQEGDPENLKNMLLFLLKNYGNETRIKKVPPPKESPLYGLYLPKNQYYKNLQDYKREYPFKEENPTIGVLLYGGMHLPDTVPIADYLYKNYKDQINFIFVYSKVEENLNAVKKYFRQIDLFLNLQYFRIHGGPYGGEAEPTYEILENLDVPLMIGLRSYETEIEKWKTDPQGINPLEIVLGVILPELDGGIEPIFIAGLESFKDESFGNVKQIKILPKRIDKLVYRMLNWIKLQKLPNKDKKVAIITYNYPPGEENLGDAGYLDVFKSLEIFLKKLKESGYIVNLSEKGENIKDLFISNRIVNSPSYMEKGGIKLDAKKYIKWFETLPSHVKEEVIDKWGPPPGDIMIESNKICIPAIELGNILIGIQPSRGVHEDLDKAYHDKELPPHHQYLAFYFYLEHKFKANAIVHFGMHGTLEFIKGKEIALSDQCFPDILIGNIPHIYYYWIGNPSESTIAKRRSYALCISHASPPMKSAGLYEKYLILEDLLDQYEEEQNEKTLELINELCKDLNFDPELQLSQIRTELYRMRRRLIPFGLHVMDYKLSNDDIINYLIGVLRIDREFPSILKLIANNLGLDWDSVKNSKKYGDIEKFAIELMEKFLDTKELPDWLPKGYEKFVVQIMENALNHLESTNLIRALSGRYIFPACAGDPIRDPNVYPTGRGMYAFDPRRIPTPIAEIRGNIAAEKLLLNYKNKYGMFPETIGIVLWGFETMKTGGDTIASILSLIGVRLLHKKTPWFKNFEIIPLEELKRPRIDVLITICGIFRDTFRPHIEFLNRAIKMVANLDEPPEKNFVRKHFLNMEQDLGDLSVARIFGPSASEYATSMRTLVESSTWDDETDLVKNYTDSMSYAYFQSNIHQTPKLFRKIMETVDLITQERDIAEFEVTDLDHYYEFLGGLARSVEHVRAKSSEVFVIDSTEDELVVEELSKSIDRATRTRILNPKWLEGMFKHEFHGVKKIKDRIENLLGFAATTHQVSNWIFEDISEKLLLDEDMLNKLKENNPYATLRIGELLLETNRRGYWETSNEVIEKIKEIISDIDSELEY